MNRKLKALGLALVAALALTAVVTSAAQAEFHSNKEHTILFGQQTELHEFTVQAVSEVFTAKLLSSTEQP